MGETCILSGICGKLKGKVMINFIGQICTWKLNRVFKIIDI